MKDKMCIGPRMLLQDNGDACWSGNADKANAHGLRPETKMRPFTFEFSV